MPLWEKIHKGEDMPAILRLVARQRCHICGGNLYPEYDPDTGWEIKCLPSGHQYIKAHELQDRGRMGGLQTFMRYGSEGMSAMGKLGGRPRIHNNRQQSAQESNQAKGVRLPNRLDDLKKLYKLRNNEEGKLGVLEGSASFPGKGDMTEGLLQLNSSRGKGNKQ